MQYSQWCKLAFICNLCFVATFAGHFANIIPGTAAGSTVIILGQLVAVFLNIFVNGWLGFLWLAKRAIPGPRWVMAVNFIILLIQGYYYFFFQL